MKNKKINNIPVDTDIEANNEKREDCIYANI